MVNDQYENLLTFEQIELTRLIFKPHMKAKEEFHIIQAQNDNSNNNHAQANYYVSFAKMELSKTFL